MKFLHVVGNRPQFVKCSVVYRAIAAKGHTQVLAHTGQHFDFNMSDIFFQEMKISKPDYQFQCGSLSHGAMTGRMLEALETVIEKEKPDRVVVYGDTNTTLATALATTKLSIPLAHVESGLRAFNRSMPEEINRILTDHCSDFLFTPTDHATKLLLQEGFPRSSIHQVGDVMYDAFLQFEKISSKNSTILADLSLSPKSYALVTIHRAGNSDDRDRLEAIIHGLIRIAKEMPILFPVHPRTLKKLKEFDLYEMASQAFHLIDPVGYLDMVQLEKNASLIITDSGGVPKEAYFSKVPCLTIRDEPIWVELIKNGFNKLVEANPEAIYSSFKTSQERNPNWDLQLYGDGTSSQKIADLLV